MRHEIPEQVRITGDATTTLPDDAQTVYIEAYNDALRDDTPTPGGELSTESAAHAVAWQAVEREFEHSDVDGKWYRHGEAPTEEKHEAGLIDKIKNLF